jgi:hypothetical protein
MISTHLGYIHLSDSVANGKRFATKMCVSIGQIQIGRFPFRSIFSVWFLNGKRFPLQDNEHTPDLAL